MSPLDDELRRTLRERADVLLPAPDPLTGIEKRARGIARRRRAAVALSGAVAVVAVLAVALPQLSSRPGRSQVVQLAGPPPSSTLAPTPTNLLGWEPRGDAQQSFRDALLTTIAGAYGSDDPSSANYSPLYTGRSAGVPYTIGQAWMTGDTTAHTFGYAQLPTGSEVFFGTVTPADAPLIAFQIGNLPGASTDLLVLVPPPGTQDVSYSPDATAAFAPVDGFRKAPGQTDRAGLPDVGLVDRSRSASNDRVRVTPLDVNHPSYEGPVQPFLCAAKECG